MSMSISIYNYNFQSNNLEILIISAFNLIAMTLSHNNDF